MHTITVCPRCGKDFMYHWSDVHLLRDTEKEIERDYPIQDEMWPSRRWNKDRTESVDLSGYNYQVAICQNCDELDRKSIEEKSIMFGVLQWLKEQPEMKNKPVTDSDSIFYHVAPVKYAELIARYLSQNADCKS